MYVYTDTYTYTCMYTHIYIYVYIRWMRTQVRESRLYPRVALLASLSLSASAWSTGVVVRSSCRGDPRRFCCTSLRLLLRGGSESGRTFVTRTMATDEVLAGSTRADTWLRDKGVQFSSVQQEQATGRCRDSAEERGVSLRQIIKSMVFFAQSELGTETAAEGGTNTFVHCMLPGHLQVDTVKLEKIVGGAVRLIESDELLRVTGAVVGAVHPFVQGVHRRLVDKRIVQIAAGSDTNGLVSFNTGSTQYVYIYIYIYIYGYVHE